MVLGNSSLGRHVRMRRREGEAEGRDKGNGREELEKWPKPEAPGELHRTSMSHSPPGAENKCQVSNRPLESLWQNQVSALF